MFTGSNYCVFFIVNLSEALIEGFQTRVGYCLSWRCHEARSWSDPICQSCHISKGGILLENEILRNTLKVYFPVQLKTNYVFPCRFKQWFNHYLIDTIENVYLNFCTLIFRDNILFDFQVLFLHYSECECLNEQNIFWFVGQPDFGFPPIKECKNVKSNIIILWDVPLEFRNWYPFYQNRSVDNITLPK